MAEEIAVRDGLLDRAARVGMWLAASEGGDMKDPRVQGMAAALRLYYAAELGLPPLAASELSLIGGRLVVSAQLLRALAAGNGYRVVRIESTDTSCTAALLDASTNDELGRSTFTIEDARRGGLIRDGSGYQRYPARMLWARASAFVVKDYAPHVALGLVTQEEAQEISAGGGTGVDATVTPAPADDVQDADWSDVPEALRPPDDDDPERVSLTGTLVELAVELGKRDEVIALIRANRELESPERHKLWLQRQITAAVAKIEAAKQPPTFQAPEGAVP